MIGIVARHESASLLRGMQTWLLAALMAVLFGYWFLKQLEIFLSIQAQLAAQDHPVGLSGYMSVRYLEPLALIFTVAAPLLAMRSFSDEFRHQTLALWQSSPVSITALVFGKFLGVCLIVSAWVLLAASLLFILRLYVALDVPVVLSATFGLWLCACSATACGLFFSSLTRHSLVAVTVSLVVLILLWMLADATVGSLSLAWLSELSIATHLRGFFQGYIKSNDVVYFLLLTLMFLGLTIVRLDALRHTGR